jgi:hypothetical protein
VIDKTGAENQAYEVERGSGTTPDKDRPGVEPDKRRGADKGEKKRQRVSGADPVMSVGEREFVVEGRPCAGGRSQAFAKVPDRTRNHAPPLGPLTAEHGLFGFAGLCG